MNEPLNEFDREGITCPYVFKHPSSPHLAASLENRSIETARLLQSTKILEKHYDIVIIEGAGGLFVPLSTEKYIIDHIQINQYPLILVTSSKLGSINHTVLSVEACKKRDVALRSLVYNTYPANDKRIYDNSYTFLNANITLYYKHIHWILLHKDNNLSKNDLLNIFFNQINNY